MVLIYAVKDLVSLLAILCLSADAQTKEWAWMSGSSSVSTACPGGQVGAFCGAPGVYGTLGTPASGNTPGGRLSPVAWADSNNHLWLYGGFGYSDASGGWGYLNDLWKFDPSTGEWVWINGSSTIPSCAGNQQGFACPGISPVYGSLGTPAATTTPGGQAYAVGWNASGNFWFFGGYGGGVQNSLWEFNPSTTEWAWMGGADTLGQPGVFGTLGSPAAGNVPGARRDASSWTAANGNFWLFGGYGYGTSIAGAINDLWKYDTSSNEWAWMSGSTNPPGWDKTSPATYGTLGTPAAGNTPGGREDPMTWTDAGGDLWLFGGSGSDVNGNWGLLNDLWKFDPSTDEWAWMGGSATENSSGVYGTLGVPNSGNIPGARELATTWTDQNGNIWLFGGIGYDSKGNQDYLNDLWEFDLSANEWTWMGGNSTTGSANGVYGTLGTPTPSNIPGGRGNAVGWTDADGNLWLFGGMGYDSTGHILWLNDLWEYQPYQIAATPTFSVPTGIYTAVQTVTISDATVGAIIYYTTDGTTPTTNSAVYSGFIPVSKTETVQAIAAATGYSRSAVATATYTVNLPVPTFTITGTSVTVARGATTGNTSTITVTPSGGFTGSVALTAAVTSSPTGSQYPPTLSFGSTTPVSITGTTAGTATLTVSTTAATSAALAYPKHRNVPWYAAGGTLLAGLLLFGIPARRRSWRTMLGMLCLLVALGGGVLACGGSGSGGGGGGGSGNPGTTAGAYTVTVTGTSGNLTQTTTLTVTVN